MLKEKNGTARIKKISACAMLMFKLFKTVLLWSINSSVFGNGSEETIVT